MSEKLHVLLRRARLQWAEQADAEESDWALKEATSEAEYLIAMIKVIQQARVLKGGAS